MDVIADVSPTLSAGSFASPDRNASRYETSGKRSSSKITTRSPFASVVLKAGGILNGTGSSGPGAVCRIACVIRNIYRRVAETPRKIFLRIYKIVRIFFYYIAKENLG